MDQLFVLYTVGLDLSIMAILIYLIEIRKYKTGISFLKFWEESSFYLPVFRIIFCLTLSYSGREWLKCF